MALGGACDIVSSDKLDMEPGGRCRSHGMVIDWSQKKYRYVVHWIMTTNDIGRTGT